MSATFACPHCGATYPVKPVLVGKAVRCTKCKNAFKLRPDGIADAVDGTAMAGASAQPPPAESRPAVAATPAEPPPPAKPVPVVPRPAPAAAQPAPATDPNAAAARAEAARKLNQKQEEARRAMAGTLASAAAEALKAEAVKRESAKEDKARKASPTAAGKTGAQGGAKIGPVLVVGEGERQARNARAWVLGTFLVIAAIAALVVLASLRSGPRKALDEFAAPVEEQYARYPNRLPRMQSRAWLSGGVALFDVGKVKMGAKARYDLAAAKPILAGIAKGQTYLQQYELWAPTADSAKITKAWSTKKDRDTNLQALKNAGIAITTRDELTAQLQAAGLGANGTAVLMQFLLPTHGAPQEAAQRVPRGELPDAIEVATFRGTHGTVLLDAGNKYSFPFIDYTGKALRFVGEGWPREWRVLTIEAGR